MSGQKVMMLNAVNGISFAKWMILGDLMIDHIKWLPRVIGLNFIGGGLGREKKIDE